MAKDPAFLFYPNDFISGTRFMSDEQVGKLIRLLCAQFDLGHLKESHMLNICKSYDEDVFSKFEIDSEGRFYNKRLELEAYKRKAYNESRRKNRSHMNNICRSYVPHMEDEDVNRDINRNKKDKESVRGKERVTSEDLLMDEAFSRFWENYPRKVAKQMALKAWSKVKYQEIDQILTSLERFKTCDDWTRDGGQFIPHPATWLNGRRWEDEITTKTGRNIPTDKNDPYWTKDWSEDL